MSDLDRTPAWKRFEDHEGPSEDERTEALRKRRHAEGFSVGQFENTQSGERLFDDTPRHSKHNRKFRVR